MDNVNNLLEGASPYQVLQDQSAKLANKWGKSGLLEGIESSTEKNNMAILLENQAKQLVNEASSTGTVTNITAGNSEAWAGVALPLVRRVFGEIVAKDLVSVQPMNLPAGLIFYLDFQYGTNGNFKSANESLYGAKGVGTDTIKLTDVANSKGLYGAGEFGYSVSESAKDVTFGAASDGVVATGKYETGSATFTDILGLDTEFSSSHAGEFGGASGATSVVQTFKVLLSDFTALDIDKDAVRTMTLACTGTDEDNISGSFPQFTRINGNDIELVISSAANIAFGTVTVKFLKGPDNLNDRGDFEDSIPAAGVSTQSIPEINVKLVSDTVAAKTRKLKAQWTPEFAQDLNAYHSIDAEAELTSILSEYISMEIDLEILDILMRNADTVEGGSAKIAQDVSVSTNDTSGGTSYPTFTSTQNNLGVYYTKMSWFQTLGVKLQKVSNLIHQKTLRGGANFMVVSPKISTILESIPGFAADSPGDQNKYAMGVQKIGAINSRYTV